MMAFQRSPDGTIARALALRERYPSSGRTEPSPLGGSGDESSILKCVFLPTPERWIKVETQHRCSLRPPGRCSREGQSLPNVRDRIVGKEAVNVARHVPCCDIMRICEKMGFMNQTHT